MGTQFPQTLQPDAPKQLDASYKMDLTDRRYIDDQIRALQQSLTDLLVNGVIGTWYTLSPSSVPVVAGDCVCEASSSLNTITKATSASLVLAGAVLGIVLVGGSPGSKIKVAVIGTVTPAVTGLGATPGPVIVNQTTGRCQQVASVAAGQFAVGFVDAAGNLDINPVVANNTPWSPSQFGASLAFWVRGDVVTNDGSGKASAWPDISGANLLAPAQATSGNRPTISATGGPNGTPCLTFNGTTSVLDCGGGTPTTGTQMAVFAVYQSGSLTSGQMVIGRLFNAASWALQGSVYRSNTANTGRLAFTGNSTGESASHAVLGDSVWRWCMGSYDGVAGISRVALNGDEQLANFAGGTGVLPANASDHVSIGAGASNASTYQRFLNGQIAEIIIINRLATTQDLANIAAYFFQRYGLGDGTPFGDAAKVTEYTASPGQGLLGSGVWPLLHDPLGDLDVQIDFSPTTLVSTSQGSGYIYYETAAAGETSIRFDVGTGNIILKVKGVDVLNTNAAADFPSFVAGDTVSIRAWWRPSLLIAGEAGIMTACNGAWRPAILGTPSGTALQTPTNASIGTDGAGANPFGMSSAKITTRRTGAQACDASSREIVLIGDSITYSPGSPFGTPTTVSRYYTTTDLANPARVGVGALATSGNTLAAQKTAYDASPWKNDPRIVLFDILCGINDITTGSTLAQVTAALQTLINDILNANPRARINVCLLTPAKSAITGPQYTIWQQYAANAYNSGNAAGVQYDVAGLTPGTIAAATIPVTGMHYVTTRTAYGQINNGSDDYVSTYDSGDHKHPSVAGERLIASFRRQAATALGI